MKMWKNNDFYHANNRVFLTFQHCFTLSTKAVIHICGKVWESAVYVINIGFQRC